MKRRNFILFSVFLFLLHGLAAQNINGLEIPIGKFQRSSISFHSAITAYSQSDKSLPYRVATVGSNMITIETDKEVKTACGLLVSEGGRTHRFILVYKGTIDLADQDKDFSDLKALDRLVKSMNSSAAQGSTTQPADLAKSPNVGNPPVIDNTQGVNGPPANDNFLQLVDSADKLKNIGQLQDAKTKYEQALLLRPDNDYVKAQLEEVTKAMAQKSSVNYDALIIKANNAFSSGQYEDALKSYYEALAIKPGDTYAAGQVDLIKKKQEKVRIEETGRQKDSLFYKYISLGDKASSEKSYEEAEIAYSEALKIKPDNPLANSKITSVRQKAYADSLENTRKATDALYTSFINSGNKALTEKSYDAARLAFTKALAVRPGDAVATSKLNSIDQQIAADSLLAERAKTLALHDGYINAGDEAFKNNLLDEAKSNYSQALTIDPKDNHAKDQIKKIDVMLEQSRLDAQKLLEAQQNAEREKQYKELIAGAESYYNSGLLDEAKNGYQKALALNSKDSYSKNKIIQIDNLIAAQKRKAKQDSINTEKYTATVLKADGYFDNKNYAAATASYSEALKYRKDDQYVQSKLLQVQAAEQAEVMREKEIKDSITKENELAKQYNLLITKANAAYSKNDLAMAKGLYVSASELKPDEELPKNKIGEIDVKIKEIAFLEEQKKLSDSLSDLGDLAIVDSNYTAALNYYTKALACNQKEHEQYLSGQVLYVQKQLALKDSAIVRANRLAYQQLKIDELKGFYHQAMDSITAKKYAAALIYFNRFIDTAHSLDFVPEEYDVARFLSFAERKVIDINESLERDKNKQVTIQKAPDKAALPSRKTIFYPNPKDPKLDPIYRKYPDIDFNRPPDNQLFDSISDYSVENKLISKEFMAVKSLSLSENSDNTGIVLTCQNIFFKGAKMYIKLMIQNLTETEFLTGRMDLVEKKADGKIVHILPNYVAGYPIILPYQQKIVVYVTRIKEIPDDENLHFEVIDRLNKIKVAIDIPGTVYNSERKKTY